MSVLKLVSVPSRKVVNRSQNCPFVVFFDETRRFTPIFILFYSLWLHEKDIYGKDKKYG